MFVNRLKQKIKLQSDPTIIYGLVGGKGTLGRPIKRSEITQPSPYNTYVIEGLPPGPISNPGRASLEATANPARTRDLYFVADGTGGHSFTETYDAHLKNVSKLRAMEKQIQNDTVEPAEEVPRRLPLRAPADNAPTATTPAAGPARRGSRRQPRARRTGSAGPPGRRATVAAGDPALVADRPCGHADAAFAAKGLKIRVPDGLAKFHLSGESHLMALSSMTGFARSHGASGPYTFEWELKSVNAKGFDLRVRLPQGFDELEAHAKKRAGRGAGARHGLRQSHRQARQCRRHGPRQRGRAQRRPAGGLRDRRQGRCGGAER